MTEIIEGSTLPNPKELTNQAELQLKNWKNGLLEESDPSAIIFLDEYAKKVPGFSGDDYGSDRTPWSATFISFIMLAGDSNFPIGTSHFDYVTAAMNGKAGYEVFPLKNYLKVKVEIGDICVRPREGGYTNSHGDLVYKIEGNKAYLIGGNRGTVARPNDGLTVRASTIELEDGYITDKTTLSYKLLVKKTNNKYYKGKNLSKLNASNVDVGLTTPVSTLNSGQIIIAPSNEDIEFYKAILVGIGAPVTNNNLRTLYAWRSAEGGTAAFNPFNTTQKMPDTTNYNCNKGNPVKNYSSAQNGIEATVKTLKNKYYPSMLTGLISESDISVYINELRKWGTGDGLRKELLAKTLNPPPISRITTQIKTC